MTEEVRRKRCYVRLNNAEDVRRELAKIYREARTGKTTVGAVSQLANVLAITSRVMTESELARRLEAIEKQLGIVPAQVSRLRRVT